jgi:hypothetical protein
MPLLTMTEQKLLVSLLNKSITSAEQKVYLQRVSFYKAIWKLRDAGLVSNQSIDIDDRKGKLWKLTLDGIVMARILSKQTKAQMPSASKQKGKSEGKSEENKCLDVAKQRQSSRLSS